MLDSDEHKILPNIKRVAGASAGSITALAVSLCTNAKDITDMANTLDFSKVPQKENKGLSDIEEHVNGIIEHIEKAVGLTLASEDIHCLLRLLKNYGWYSSEYIYSWFRTQIQAGFEKKKLYEDGDGLQTFAQFKEAGFRDLYVSVTDITTHCNKIFSAETAPDMPVAEAVRMSMSIPLYFESIKFNNDQYADGGTVNNYPMEVFDKPGYVSDPANFKDGINNETLGCHLFTPEGSVEKIQKIGLVQYVIDLMKTLLNTQEIEFSQTPNLIKRSANISNCGISAVDFDITVGGPEYKELYGSGQETMIKYLEDYKE
ncbi:MAG: patatin-like phospholipase family protein [Fibrobacteraceae bacterium]|nr:patatin-like phospholipase family protein [Fibrobacteraceae bacterium]